MENLNVSEMAVSKCFSGVCAFCKFLTANDTGESGAHQSGIYLPKNAYSLVFERKGIKGEQLSKDIDIEWFDGNITHSRAIYYGDKSRNEYRITKFPKYRQKKDTGSLLVLVRDVEDKYYGYLLKTDDEIEYFLESFGLTPPDTNKLIDLSGTPSNLVLSTLEKQEDKEILEFIEKLTVDFPLSEEMSAIARQIENNVYDHKEAIKDNPDKKLVRWTQTEFKLFRQLENVRYGDKIKNGFSTVDDFVKLANQVLNRRKSRAGKSLEHHLKAIFIENNLPFTEQCRTEGNKKPDFVFPSQEAYKDLTYPAEKLVVLGAKTTCKDRWRQILNEADRIKPYTKFLCTLQQGITKSQLEEMKTENVILVVPAEYIKDYPKSEIIWTLKQFIDYVKETIQTN